MIATMKKTFVHSLNKQKQKYMNVTLGKRRMFIIGIIMSLLIILCSMNFAFADALGISEIWQNMVDAIKGWSAEQTLNGMSWINEELFANFPKNMDDFYVLLSTRNSVEMGEKFSLLIVKPINTVAYIITVGLFVFHLFVCAFGNFTEQRNTPLNLIVRFFIVMFLTQFAYEIASCFMYATNLLIDETVEFASTIRDEFNGVDLEGAGYNDTIGDLVGFIFLGFIVYLVLAISVIVNMIKMLLEIYKRFILAVLLNLCMPLGLSFMVSRTTANITVSYIRMYLSQLFLLLFSYISCTLSYHLFMNYGNSIKLSNLIFVLAFMKVMQNVDSYIGSLGLNVAHTSGSLFDDIAITGRSLGNLVTGMQRVGRSLGNAKNRVLDGQMLSAMKGNDFVRALETGNKQGKTDAQTAKGYVTGGALVGMNAIGNDKAFRTVGKTHNNGQAIPFENSATANEYFKKDFGANHIEGMKGNDFSNVKYENGGRITADFVDENGSRKRAVFTDDVPLNGSYSEKEMLNGGRKFMQIQDLEGNIPSEITNDANVPKEGVPLGNTDEEDLTKNTQDEQLKKQVEDDEYEQDMERQAQTPIKAEEEEDNNKIFSADSTSESSEDDDEESEEQPLGDKETDIQPRGITTEDLTDGNTTKDADTVSNTPLDIDDNTVSKVTDVSETGNASAIENETATSKSNDIPMGITCTPEEAEQFREKCSNFYGVKPPASVAMQASKAKLTSDGDLAYYDSNDNLIAVQTTPHSISNYSKYGGSRMQTGTTFYPESNENSLDSWGESNWMNNIPISMQNEFVGKDNKPPQVENLGNGTSGVYTIHSTNVVTDEKTTTRAVSFAENQIDLSNKSAIERYLKKDEEVEGKPKFHESRNGSPSYFTFNVRQKRQKESKNQNNKK